MRAQHEGTIWIRNWLLRLKVEQNLYPQTSQISSIAHGGYYHDAIKQQVNNCDELQKWISLQSTRGITFYDGYHSVTILITCLHTLCT